MAKSNLFALLVIPSYIKRDKAISTLLNNESIEYTNPKYISGGGNYGISYSSNFNIIKTWKTLIGAESYLKNFVLVNSNKFGYQYSVVRNEIMDDNTYNATDWIDVSYEIVNIVDKWNDHIYNELILENKRHLNIIKKLENNIIK